MARGLNILVYANGPNVPTGFGTVIRNIFEGVVSRGKVPIADINFFAINHVGDPHNLPFKIWPAQVAATRDPDLFGRSRFANLLLNNQWPCDVLFLLEDTFTLSSPVPTAQGMQPFVPFLIQSLKEQEKQGRPPVKVVQYIPIDGSYLRPDWINWIAPLVDYPVAYTEFGRQTLLDYDASLKGKLGVIPHGTNPDVFFRVSPAEREAFRREQLKLDPGAKLIVNVNRNQPRKDIPRTLQIFRKVFDRDPSARLYLHMNVLDSAGYDLRQIIHQLRLPQHSVLFPMNFSEGVGIPVQALNLIYNAADVYMTTARGEGWGLPLTEAMTVGVPCVAPDHTSYGEILDSGRGVLVTPEPSGSVMPSDNDQFRPVADVDAMAAAVLGLLHDPGRAAAIAERATQWALNNTWRNHVVPQWEEILLRCHRDLFQPPVPEGSARQRFSLSGLSVAAPTSSQPNP